MGLTSFKIRSWKTGHVEEVNGFGLKDSMLETQEEQLMLQFECKGKKKTDDPAWKQSGRKSSVFFNREKPFHSNQILNWLMKPTHIRKGLTCTTN